MICLFQYLVGSTLPLCPCRSLGVSVGSNCIKTMKLQQVFPPDFLEKLPLITGLRRKMKQTIHSITIHYHSSAFFLGEKSFIHFGPSITFHRQVTLSHGTPSLTQKIRPPCIIILPYSRDPVKKHAVKG